MAISDADKRLFVVVAVLEAVLMSVRVGVNGRVVLVLVLVLDVFVFVSRVRVRVRHVIVLMFVDMWLCVSVFIAHDLVPLGLARWLGDGPPEAPTG